MNVEFLKNWCGWGGVVNCDCQRPWAIKCNGEMVRSRPRRDGSRPGIRTFATKAAAEKWAARNLAPVEPQQ